MAQTLECGLSVNRVIWQVGVAHYKEIATLVFSEIQRHRRGDGHVRRARHPKPRVQSEFIVPNLRSVSRETLAPGRKLSSRGDGLGNIITRWSARPNSHPNGTLPRYDPTAQEKIARRPEALLHDTLISRRGVGKTWAKPPCHAAENTKKSGQNMGETTGVREARHGSESRHR